MKSKEQFRYPIGQFEYGKTYSMDEIRKNMELLERFPKQLKKTLKKLRRDEYDIPYRQGGWTVRQVVHHLADSHMNAYMRMKMAVTETIPQIKPYEQDAWSNLEDAVKAPIRMSIRMLSALHRRWIFFIKSLSEEELEKGYYHPDLKRTIPVAEAVALYTWHAQHHLEHIKLVITGQSYAQEGVAVPKQPAPKPLQQAGHRRFETKLVDKTAPGLPDNTTGETVKKRPGRPKATADNTAGDTVKKRPGRPKAAADNTAGDTVKKRPGRPKAAADNSAGDTVKKRPGRPKAAADNSAGETVKKRPGRPKVTADNTAGDTVKKRPGRPKVNPTPAPEVTPENPILDPDARAFE